MTPPTVCAVVIVKNEENNIDRCLKHLTWADEIIIIDNGSTDKTVEIARKYTGIIQVRKGGKYDSVLDNKNFGFSIATKDWVLSIDADEIVPEACKEEILTKIQESTYDAYYFNFKQFFFGKEFVGPLWTTTKIVRLFKRGKGLYNQEYSHQIITIDGTIGRITSPIHHHGYPDIETFIKKMNYYTSFEAQLLYDGKIAGLLKKPIKKMNLYYLVIEPLLFFPHYFFIKKNYKDGLHGFVFSVLMTFYLFVERAKLWILLTDNKK